MTPYEAASPHRGGARKGTATPQQTAKHIQLYMTHLISRLRSIKVTLATPRSLPRRDVQSRPARGTCFFFFFLNKLRDTSLSCGTINYSQPSRMRPGWDGLTRLTLLCIPLTVTHLNLGDRQASAQRRDSTGKTTSQYQRPSTVAGKQNLPWGQRVPSEESRLT